MFENRKYRSDSGRKGLTPFRITVKETDLHIQADRDLSEIATRMVLKQRGYVEAYIDLDPAFRTSLKPVDAVVPAAARIISDMIDAGKKAGVGPMAAIAGAIAECTGRELLKSSKEVIVENGGDIFFHTDSEMTFSIFAGNSPLSMKIGAKISPGEKGRALCTSSGTIGHSLSFGKADAATVISHSCALADAAATALGNIVKNESDIEKAIEAGQAIEGVEGIIIIKGKKLGAWGDLELVRISQG